MEEYQEILPDGWKTQDPFSIIQQPIVSSDDIGNTFNADDLALDYMQESMR
jgi:hypothetical protein